MRYAIVSARTLECLATISFDPSTPVHKAIEYFDGWRAQGYFITDASKVRGKARHCNVKLED